jgi:hypothetical protein
VVVAVFEVLKDALAKKAVTAFLYQLRRWQPGCVSNSDSVLPLAQQRHWVVVSGGKSL